MSTKNVKKKNCFITALRGYNRESHKILINERVFYLHDIKKWKLYLKLILQYINYLHELNEKNIEIFLKEVITEVNNDSRAFSRKMGYELGDWGCF